MTSSDWWDRYALAKDGIEAGDLVQDARVRVYERRFSLRSDGNLRAWLFSILHNTFVEGTSSRSFEVARLKSVTETTTEVLEAPQGHVVRLAQIRAAFLEIPEEQR